MVKKSDIVKEAVRKEDWKKALQTAKDFHIGITQEQRDKMARAYECIVHPDFYQQIGIDIPEAIEQGKAVVKEYVENVRRKNIMKWDVKHDLAKRVIDAFLEGADTWQKTGEFVVPNRRDVTGDLTEEEMRLVSEEVELMIASIRKRYKLKDRLQDQPTEQTEKKEPELVPMPGIEKLAELKKEYEKPAKQRPEVLAEQKAEEVEEKPKRGRKTSDTEKKPTAKRGRKKKTEQEENATTEQATA